MGMGEGFTPAELVRRAPDGGHNDLTVIESLDIPCDSTCHICYPRAAEVGQEAFTRIRELHQPRDEEAEFWAEGGSDDGVEHDRRFPDCLGGDLCEGHSATIKVCGECGYEHDGEMPTFRSWPCPTILALDDRAGLSHDA